MDLPSSIVSNPPREVPLSTRLVLLFGGPVAVLGWVFTGMGLMFAVVFAGNADLSSWRDFRGPLETAPGLITTSEETHASEGGGKHSRGTPIYERHFKFHAGGRDYEGTSYCTGGGLRDGQAVTVEFPAGRPDVSRIQGMRRALFGPAVAFVLTFPLIGFALAGGSLWMGRKNISLLIHGELAQARNTGKEATNSRVNNRTVYKMWFEFTDRTGELQKVSLRTSKPENLEGRVFEQLFYDVSQPTRCVLFHSLPGNVTFDERGGIKPCGFWRVARATWAPLLALVFFSVSLLLHRLL